MALRRCNGTVFNGPDKRFGRCSKCGNLDYELYEGDRCREMVEDKPKKRRRRAG